MWFRPHGVCCLERRSIFKIFNHHPSNRHEHSPSPCKGISEGICEVPRCHQPSTISSSSVPLTSEPFSPHFHWQTYPRWYLTNLIFTLEYIKQSPEISLENTGARIFDSRGWWCGPLAWAFPPLPGNSDWEVPQPHTGKCWFREIVLLAPFLILGYKNILESCHSE